MPGDVQLKILSTTGPGTAADLARNSIPETDMFLAVGGDGTVSEVSAGLYGSGIPLAIIPAGSTNIIAREYGIPTHTERAIALAFGDHHLDTLDLGFCNDRPFMHMAGMGFDSYMFELTNSDLKRKLGWAAYLPAAGRALTKASQNYRITADGTHLECRSPLVLVANGSCVLSPKIRLHPAISSNDGLLDLFIFNANTPLSLLRTISRFVGQSLAKSPFVKHIQVRTAEIESDSPVPVEMDGDIVTSTPARFRIEPGSIRLVVPQDAGQ